MAARLPRMSCRMLRLGTALLLFIFLPAAAQAAELAVPNGSFEAPSLLNWTARAWSGPAPQVELVQDIRRHGRQSVRISGTLPADFSLTQNIRALPGSAWRVRACIRTQDLKGTARMPYGGGLVVGTIDSRTTLAQSLPQLGTAGWREVDVPFRMPREGQVALALVFVGFGPGTGTVWFDDVRLERVPPEDVEEKVLDFPIDWGQGAPYNKFLPADGKGGHGAWSCGQVAVGLLIGYWSRQVDLRCSGTYFYYARDSGQRVFADYNKPFQWNRMVATLRGLPYDDPRVDPIADFVYRLCVARRTEWPRGKNGLEWFYGRDLTEALAKHFGFDLSGYQRILFKPFIGGGGRWDQLAGIVRREIDAGQPVILHMGNTVGGGHFVVITGYRRVGPHYGFMVHFGWHRRYNPNIAWPLDGWIGPYDLPLDRNIRIGLKPYAADKPVPLYNKVAELRNSDYDAALTHASLAWNPDRREYAAVFQGGPAKTQHLYFQRTSSKGMPVGETSLLQLSGNCRKPVIAWSGTCYGLVWEERSEKIGTVYFTRLSPDGSRVLDPQPVRIGSGATDPARPSVSLAWTGKEFAIAWSDNGQIRFSRISGEGVRLPDSEKSIAAGIDPHLVWLGDSHVLTFVAGGAVQLVRLDPDGNTRHPPRKILPQPNLGTWTPRVCWSGTQFGVAWEHVGQDRRHHICFARADAQCNPIAGSFRMISDFNNPPAWVIWPAISTHNGEFIVTYDRGDAYLTRISPKGEPLENRYLFWDPTGLTHVTQGNVTHVLYVHANSGERLVEVESCLIPLDGSGADPAPEGRQTRK